jgi:hypothetical protein
MRKIYSFIVGKRGIDPNYFFDEMEASEIGLILEAYEDEFKNNWEQTRAIVHAVISSQSSKPVSPEEVLKFNWDNESTKSAKGVSDEDRERLMNKINK